MRFTLTLLIGAAFFAGCSGSDSTETSGDNSITISKTTFHGTWPFVDSGTLRCEPPQSVVFTANGTEYGVNGSALDAGFKDARRYGAVTQGT